MIRKSFILFLFLALCGYVFAGGKRPCGDPLPIVYSPDYNMSILGIEYLHPFDSHKFKKIYKYLVKHCGLCKSQFQKPYKVTDSALATVHSAAYLKSLKKSSTVARILEMPPLRLLPNFVLRGGLLNPMRLGTGGTLVAVDNAFSYGWAINLAGGYHHAKSSSGEGFCVFADIPLAANKIWERKPDCRILVIDLDAHQGNGVSLILGKDPRIAILDMFNERIYPNDLPAEANLSHPVPLESRTRDREYLALLENALAKSITDHNPEFIMYNAGTDIYEKDPLGRLSITAEGILKRDQMVFETAVNNKIPIVMVLSGGYHKDSGNIIGRSIARLLKTTLAGHQEPGG